MDLRKIVRKEYFDPNFFQESAYGKLMAQTHSYRWLIRTPVRNYYGEMDEAISIGVGKLAMDYQQAMGAGNPKVVAISTGDTSHRGHRGTYAKAVGNGKLGLINKPNKLYKTCNSLNSLILLLLLENEGL